MAWGVYSWLIILGITEGAISYWKRSKSQSRKTTADRFSLLVLWITVPTCIGLSVIITELAATKVPLNEIFYIGLALSIIGSVIRWSAIAQLKQAFTVDVSIVSDHQLTTTGVYTLLRHPSYTGLLLNYVGAWIALQNIYLLLCCSIAVFIAVSYRISVEEKVLLSEFGAEYEHFIKSTKKLIPFIY